jgi:hypothetical protein
VIGHSDGCQDGLPPMSEPASRQSHADTVYVNGGGGIAVDVSRRGPQSAILMRGGKAQRIRSRAP